MGGDRRNETNTAKRKQIFGYFKGGGPSKTTGLSVGEKGGHTLSQKKKESKERLLGKKPLKREYVEHASLGKDHTLEWRAVGDRPWMKQEREHG